MKELIPKGVKGEVKLKEWECVMVDNYRNVGKTIEDMEKKGWRLHTYWPIHVGPGTDVDHYLLFERETSS